ncbi:MAG: hypothetical protein ACI3WR_02430 [Oscillospiraceae bacterium]
MACNVVPGPITEETEGVREAVCIHTRKVMDSCRDKDCLEDLRFYPTQASAEVLANALTLKGGCCELLRVYVNVEPVCYNRGYYTIDMRYFYRVTLQAYQSTSARGTEVEGLCVFDKRCVLFGSGGGSKVFTSHDGCCDPSEGASGAAAPLAVVEAVDPIVLAARLVDICPAPGSASPVLEIPPCIAAAFCSPLQFCPASRQVLVTLGQFSIVRLERETELLIPVYDYCIPQKECSCGAEPSPCDPCEVFRGVSFPVSEFFPPSSLDRQSDMQEVKNLCHCGE